jgi:hypothetical protein
VPDGVLLQGRQPSPFKSFANSISKNDNSIGSSSSSSSGSTSTWSITAAARLQLPVLDDLLQLPAARHIPAADRCMLLHAALQQLQQEQPNVTVSSTEDGMLQACRRCWGYAQVLLRLLPAAADATAAVQLNMGLCGMLNGALQWVVASIAALEDMLLPQGRSLQESSSSRISSTPSGDDIPDMRNMAGLGDRLLQQCVHWECVIGVQKNPGAFVQQVVRVHEAATGARTALLQLQAELAAGHERERWLGSAEGD